MCLDIVRLKIRTVVILTPTVRCESKISYQWEIDGTRPGTGCDVEKTDGKIYRDHHGKICEVGKSSPIHRTLIFKKEFSILIRDCYETAILYQFPRIDSMKNIQGFMIDLDGVLYTGNQAIDGAQDQSDTFWRTVTHSGVCPTLRENAVIQLPVTCHQWDLISRKATSSLLRLQQSLI